MNRQEDTKKSKLKILLAEDDEISQLVFKKMTESINCEVDVANNGSVALEYTKESTYDILFFDLHMPFLDGYELITKIKGDATNTNANALYILASGTASDKEKQKALELGFNDILLKPYSKNHLFSIINNYYDHDFEFEFEKDTHVDLTKLNKLYNNNESIVKEIIKTIKEEIPKSLAKIEEPDFFKDPRLIKEFIHKIRPSFSYLGLNKIAAQLLELETNLEKGVFPKNIKLTCRKIAEITTKTLNELD